MHRLSAPIRTVSRQSEKFLLEQSRKFLLTAKNWKDGTNRDEPGGTRLAGVAEAGAERGGHAAAGGGEDGRHRSLGAKAAGAHEDRGRRRCGARSAGPVVEPVDRRADTGAALPKGLGLDVSSPSRCTRHNQSRSAATGTSVDAKTV